MSCARSAREVASHTMWCTSSSTPPSSAPPPVSPTHAVACIHPPYIHTPNVYFSWKVSLLQSACIRTFRALRQEGRHAHTRPRTLIRVKFHFWVVPQAGAKPPGGGK
eukprot:4605479-Pyramimonas_sp.AAC.3